MQKVLNIRHLIPISLIIITAIGLFLRLRILNQSDLWLDEAFTGIFVRAEWSEMFKMIILDFVHPPLYYILTKLWTLIFNSSSPEIIRLFSITLGTSLIPLSYIFTNKLLNSKNRLTSILTSLIFAFNPFFISYSIEARSYSLLAVLGLLTLIIFLDILRREHFSFDKKYAYFILLSILLVCTHYISSIYLLSLGITYLILKPKNIKTFLDLLKLFLPSVLTIFAILLTFFTLRDNITSTNFNIGNVGWISKASILNIPMTIYNFIFGVQTQGLGTPEPNVLRLDLLQPNILSIILTLLILIPILILTLKKKYSQNLVFLLCISLLPILLVILLSSFGIQMYIERYMIIFGVGILLLSAFLLSEIKPLIGILVTAIYIVLTLFITPIPTTEKYSEICGSINGSSITVDDPNEYILFEYYCNRSKIQLYTRNRSFYNDYWLIIGYQNTIDRIDSNNTYFIKSNNEVEAETGWKDILNTKVLEIDNLTLYKLNN